MSATPQSIAARWPNGSACSRNHARILRMIANGAGATEIARTIRCNRRHLRAHLKAHGISLQPVSRAGDKNPAWTGGRQQTKRGCWLVLQPDHPHANRHGYCWEHRLVMERMIGRLLLRTEVVHHRDGDPSNNDPKNLQLFQSNAEHLRHELTGVPCPQRGRKWTAKRRAEFARQRRGKDGRLLPGKSGRSQA